MLMGKRLHYINKSWIFKWNVVAYPVGNASPYWICGEKLLSHFARVSMTWCHIFFWKQFSNATWNGRHAHFMTYHCNGQGIVLNNTSSMNGNSHWKTAVDGWHGYTFPDNQSVGSGESPEGRKFCSTCCQHGHRHVKDSSVSYPWEW